MESRNNVYFDWCLPGSGWNLLLLRDARRTGVGLREPLSKSGVRPPLSFSPVVIGRLARRGIDIYFHVRRVQLVVDCTQSRDTVSSRGALYTVDFVPPLTRMVVCVLSPTHGSSFYIHFQTKSRLCHPYAGLSDWGPANTLHLPETDTELLRDLHNPRPLY